MCADGSAVMVHSGPDSFANIPARYGGRDQETLNTGGSVPVRPVVSCVDQA